MIPTTNREVFPALYKKLDDRLFGINSTIETIEYYAPFTHGR